LALCETPLPVSGDVWLRVNMAELQSDKQLAVELRNSVAQRLITAKANLLYWEAVKKKSKKNTTEIATAIENMATNAKGIKADELFVSVIDGMIKDLK